MDGLGAVALVGLIGFFAAIVISYISSKYFQSDVPNLTESKKE